jgi:RND superfamily putative drug exporter
MRRRVIPVLSIVIWVIFLAVAGGYAGKLGDVVRNDNAAFLPSGAEATRVARLDPAAGSLPAVVVYERPAGVDPATVAADLTYFATLPGVAGPPTAPVTSADGQAVETVVPLTAPAAVTAIRARATGHPGLSAHVTGPGGTASDLQDVFAGADVRLLAITLVAVFVILVAVYRSVLLPIVVLLGAQFAQTAASALVRLLASHDVITLNGQAQGALILICVGVATDYALLLVGRYREELRDRPSAFEAMRAALARTAPTILASGITVILAMLCLLLSRLGSNRGFGPVLAIGVAASLLATFTFLPAVLVLLGRAAFWPRRPAFGSAHPQQAGIWGRTARLVARRPRTLWLGVAAVLLVLAAFLPTFRASGSPIGESFLASPKPDSVVGAAVLAAHFPGGSGTPALIVGPPGSAEALAAAARSTAGVQAAVPAGPAFVQATLADPPDSAAARHTVLRLRAAVRAVSPQALVGGETATAVDTAAAANRDLRTVLPLLLFVVFVLLVVLLRAVLGPLILIATVLLSVAAAFGLAALVLNHVFDYPAADSSLALFCIVFLVAVGVDYNIFLTARMRESRAAGPRTGVVQALTSTGGVITSAGVVLGVTFALFADLPFLPLVQIAIITVAGILLDTFLVRALLVPALAYDLGRWFWWPGTRGFGRDPATAAASPM